MNRDIVLVGGSAGAVDAMLQLTRELPEGFPAAVLVVIHTSPSGPGELTGLLDRISRLSCPAARDGAEIRPGRIYVAPPDYHLLVEAGLPGMPGRLKVARGPLENRHRPAIDPLFRSAAVEFGPRVIGVILSGTLDDGASGLALVKKQGGLAVIQDPEDAQFAAMPRNVLKSVQADHVVPMREMAALLTRLVQGRAEHPMETSEDHLREAGI